MRVTSSPFPRSTTALMKTKPHTLSLLATCSVLFGVGCDSTAAGGGSEGGNGSNLGGAGGVAGTGHNSSGSGVGASASSGNAGSESDGGVPGGGPGGLSPTFRACSNEQTDANLVPANLLFVVDQSGSMNCAPDKPSAECEQDPRYDPDVTSKWDITASALLDALEDLSSKPNVSVGVSLFPVPDTEDPLNACYVAQSVGVDIRPLDEDHLNTLHDFFGSVQPVGATPLVGATTIGYRQVQERLEEQSLEGQTFVVLLTDGKETCDTEPRPDGDLPLDRLLEATISDSRLLDIRTFVIGSPGSEGFRGALSQIAHAGGTPRAEDCDHSGDNDSGDCHFDMTRAADFSAGLASALNAITSDKSLFCVFDIPDANVNLSLVNVAHILDSGETTELSLDDRDCATEANGWQYITDASGEVKIELCGEACEQATTDGGKVQIILGCSSRRIQ